MIKRGKRLLLLTLVAGAVALFGACEQPEDILAPVTKTKIWLHEDRLPDNPDGMIYEFWAANSTDTVSMGKFGYVFQTRTFLDEDLEERAESNQFFLDHDIMEFDVIFVSIETDPDASASPGPIMLMDSTSKQTMELVFPLVDSLWGSTVRYSMETPSNGMSASSDGFGIWFASYTEITRSLNDTLDISSWAVETLYTQYDTIIDTNVSAIDTLSIVRKDTSLALGLDTVQQSVVRFSVIERIDTIPPYPVTRLTVTYDVDTGSVSYDDFSQDDFGLPILSDYGWKYKGWVVSDAVDMSAVGKITMPAWMVVGDELADTDGGLLTIGTFDDIAASDDENPHVDTNYRNPPRVPAYPGEDFLLSLPGGIAPPNLVPSGGGTGKVFVTVEPDNFVTDTTNFPLFAFIGDLPESRSLVTGSETQQFTLRGWMFSNDPVRGFPDMKVTIERF